MSSFIKSAFYSNISIINCCGITLPPLETECIDEHHEITELKTII